MMQTKTIQEWASSDTKACEACKRGFVVGSPTVWADGKRYHTDCWFDLKASNARLAAVTGGNNEN